MATQTLPRPAIHKNTVTNIVLWALQIGVALMLLKAGFLKLTGNPMMVGMFGAIGLGQWFRYLTGSLEVIGSIGLLIPRVAGYAALLLAVVMAGAVLTHLMILGGSPLMAALLLAANLGIVWGRLWRE